MKLIFFLILSGTMGIASGTAFAQGRPVKHFLIKARQYAYAPPVIRVDKGDEIHIRLISEDVEHGFYLEGHGINARIEKERKKFWLKNRDDPDGSEEEVEEIVFIANKTGKFRYRCSHTCGYLHPFMTGEMIVSPNYLYYSSIGGALLLVLVMLLSELSMKTRGQGGLRMNGQTIRQIDLFAKIPLLKKLVKLRGFQFLVTFPNLIIFLFFFIAGIFGSPVGNNNILTIWIWILWWFVLITIMVPFFGRIWCTVCAIPFFSDWLQRRALIKVRPGKTTGGLRNTLYGLNKRWPKRLTNIWTQNLLFLCLATISTLLVTRPMVTVVVLGGLMVVSTLLALIYRMRSFCNYICPVSGFLSLYSITAMTALRPKDRNVCQACTSKSCLRGNDKGWGCPWFVYMGNLDRNNYCGLCMECVKSCPNDNITLYARPFSIDMKLKGYDEAFKAFIMLALALVYSITLLGPWGVVKDWANVSEVGDFAGFGIYALGVWGLSLGIVPGLHATATWFSKKLAQAGEITWKDYFLRFSYPFVPLGLLAWIAFSIPLVMVNGAYILSTMSDPLGRGWNLFGTAKIPWTPVWPEYVNYLQVAVLFVGLYFAAKATLRLAEELFPEGTKRKIAAALPHLILQLVITVSLLRFFIG